MYKFLVMDANQRSGLSVTRSLGNAFPGAIIDTADSTATALAAASRFSSSYLRYPNPNTSPSELVQWVKTSVCGRYDLVLPTTEVTSQLLLHFSEELTGLNLAFAPLHTVMQLADKSNLVKTAQSAGVAVPATEFFAEASQLNIESLSYPCVLKPAQSKIFTGERWLATTVRVLHSAEDATRVLREDAYLSQYPFMIQEFIPGYGAGLFALYNHGKSVAFFAHNRIREKPPEGGVSVLSESVALPPKLLDPAKKLLESVNWHGVAMVEFRIAADGTPYLMEVNTRFWGSLQLAIDAGVDFPAQLAKLQLGLPLDEVPPYKEGQRLRWLLGDVDSLYISLKRPIGLKEKLKRVGQFLMPRFSKQRFEVNRLGDMKPFWEELRQYFR